MSPGTVRINLNRLLFVKPYNLNNGFTLIELLIVIAILAILAVVALANMGTFIHLGRVNAANSELANVQTANHAYRNDNEERKFASNSSYLEPYFDKDLKGYYEFDPETGAITGTPTIDYDGVTWDTSSGKFK